MISVLLLAAAVVVDPWSGRERHPAVVNPVARVEDGTVVSLRGEWDFTKSATNGPGLTIRNRETGHWKVQVPGCWEASGVGEPGMPPTYRCHDRAPKRIRHVWNGVGVYCTSARIPADWLKDGRRIWLAAGGIAAQGWISVNPNGSLNNNPVGHYDSYCGTYKWDVTDLVGKDGEARVLVVADNMVPYRNGEQYIAMRYGGIVRDMEFQVTPRVYIDYAWVRGDFDTRTAQAHVVVDGGKMDGMRLRVEIEGETAEVPAQPGDNVVTLPLKEFRAWSPELPSLYVAKMELLDNGVVTMTRHERFGVRKLEVRGKEFFLNGRPFFFRGCGDNHPYPQTGCSPADRDFHRAHLRMAKDAGFNYIRLHTHTEVPEYFEVADELGILLQPELPYYANAAEDPFEFDPMRDAAERRDHLRRHPSFAVASGGNEGNFARPTARAVYAMQKSTDPDRLAIEQDGFPPVDEYGVGRSDYCSGPMTVWRRGAFNPRAFIAHEYLNLCVKADSRDEPCYADTLWCPILTRKDRADWLAKFGLDHAWGDRFQDAAHVLQRIYQKMGLESARMDPYCDGYCYWTVSDTVVLNRKAGVFTAQGFLNPFWKPKRRGWTPQEFRKFNAPSVVCLDLTANPSSYPADFDDAKAWSKVSMNPWGGGIWDDTNRVFSAGDRLPLRFVLSHYGEDVESARLEWRIDGPSGTVLSGVKDLGKVVAGPAKTIFEEPVQIPPATKPYKASIAARIGPAENSWDIWIFPPRSRRDGSAVCATGRVKAALDGGFSGVREADGLPAAKVVVGLEGSAEIKAAIARGCNTVELGNQDSPANNKLGWWWIGKQAGTAIVRHPALSDFPCGDVMDQLFFRILKEGKQLPVAGIGKDDLVIAGEGVDACYSYLAVVKSPSGARRVIVSGIDLLSPTPEGAYLLDALVAYQTMK